MGGSHSSTRKLTVENEDPTSVIKVSDDVVQRLKGSQEVRTKGAPAPAWPGQQGVSAGVPGPYFLYEPSLTTIQLRQENVANLKKNDEYWNSRVRALEQNHKKIHDIMEQEYNKAVEEFYGKKKSSKKECLLPPCQDSKEAVIQCYKSNKNEPMQCSKIVKAFQDCVESKRHEILDNRA